MRSCILRLATAALLVASIGLSNVPQAFATDGSAGEDSTENRFTFDYDASSGEVTARSSYRRARRDPVRFEVGVSESEGYGSGLTGKLLLRLEGERPVTYDGWFEITITDSSDEIVFRRVVPRRIELEPRPGRRKAAIAFRFDLPSGEYEASGTFEAAQ